MSVVGRKPRVRPRPPAPRRLGGRATRVDTAQLEAQLRSEVRGEVLFDAGWRSVYTHDSGNYRHIPLGAVAPVDRDDVAAAVAVCRRLGAPVVPRGCGTSIPGTVLASDAVVIDVSKHMREIVEIDAERRFARVRPGLIRDDLTRRTEERHRLTFAPDTSTHEYATFGGMIGSNSCGVHSVMGGRTSDNVEELEVLTYDGLRMRVGATSEEELEEIIAEGGRRGEIYRGMRDLRDRYADLIRERYPDIPRRVSGYNLDDLLPENGFHVARAITGSEGTLATVLEAKVRLLPSPPERALVALGFPDVYIAGDHVAAIRERGPIALEGMDRRLITDMELRGMHPHDIPLLPEGDGWLLVEFGGDTREEALERAGEFTRWLEELDEPPAIKLVDDVGEERRLWKVREDALAATAYRLGERDHWEGWEDAAVPPERLGDYLRDFHELLDRYDYRTTLYGHFGDGCVHCRIDFDPLSVGGLRRWRSFLDEASDLIVHYGGSFSGEHGDGQARSELLPKLYGDELMEAFRQLKSIWDPDWKMNPGKVVQPDGIMSDLKLGVEYNPPQPKTYFAYPEDGGSFAHAAARCVGAGKCRDIESGTMCPSYMVTLDEKHTTRGRARILFEMLQGQTIKDGFRSQEVNQALELCLSCKGCKGDCPVNVDMATYKAEFLSRHYKRRLRPAAAYSMGLIMLHARVAQHAPRLANALPRLPVIGGALKRAAGISAQRELPRFARQTFRTWFDDRDPVNQGAPAVVRHVHQLPAPRPRKGHRRGARGGRLPGGGAGGAHVLRAPPIRLRDAADRTALPATPGPGAAAAHPRRRVRGGRRAQLRGGVSRRAGQHAAPRRGRQAAQPPDADPGRVPGGPRPRLGHAEAVAPGDRPRALPPQGGDGHVRRGGDPGAAGAGLRAARLRLLRRGRVVRLRGRPLRPVGEDRRAAPAPRGALSGSEHAGDLGRLQLPYPDHPADRPPSAAPGRGDQDGPRRGRRRLGTMKAKQLTPGPPSTHALIFERGDEAMEGLRAFTREQGITAAHLTGIGAFSDVTLGYFDWESKEYERIQLDEQVEVVTLAGDVALKDDEPDVHAHVVVAKRDGTAHGGHLIEAHVRPTLEVVVEEAPAHLRKRTDPESGLALIDPEA